MMSIANYSGFNVETDEKGKESCSYIFLVLDGFKIPGKYTDDTKMYATSDDKRFWANPYE